MGAKTQFIDGFNYNLRVRNGFPSPLYNNLRGPEEMTEVKSAHCSCRGPRLSSPTCVALKHSIPQLQEALMPLAFMGTWEYVHILTLKHMNIKI